jgi:hypothetical protein
MMPANFVRLGDLPRLPNGKIDRRALPLPGEFRRREEGRVISPRTEVETLIAQIMAGGLACRRHRALTITSSIRWPLAAGGASRGENARCFNKPAALRDLFDGSDRRGLGSAGGKGWAKRSEKICWPSRRRQPGETWGCSFGQKQLFLFSQLFGGADFLNLP